MTCPRYTRYAVRPLTTNCEQGAKGKDDLHYWENFVKNFFAENGVFRYTIPNTDENDDQMEKLYEITFPALPRYFYTHFESGVKTVQLFLDKDISDRVFPDNTGRHEMENKKASMVYWFDSGSHVSASAFWSESVIEMLIVSTVGSYGQFNGHVQCPAKD